MKTLTTTFLLLATGLTQAQEVGQVISRTAVYQQVAVPRQTCTQTPVAVQNTTSGAGALMGAIAGAAVGNQIGGGSGRALATVAGFMGGAILGDRIENPGSQIQNQTTCTTQTVYEKRLSGYNVARPRRPHPVPGYPPRPALVYSAPGYGGDHNHRASTRHLRIPCGVRTHPGLPQLPPGLHQHSFGFGLEQWLRSQPPPRLRPVALKAPDHRSLPIPDRIGRLA